jgi:hypothetical protein
VCWDWSNIQKPHICVLGLVKDSETPHLCAGTGQIFRNPTFVCWDWSNIQKPHICVLGLVKPYLIPKKDNLKQGTHTHACTNIRMSLSSRFFDGKMHDTTTKESRKAAETLSLLKNTQRNPHWKPLNSKVRMRVSKCEMCASSSTYRFNCHLGWRTLVLKFNKNNYD